MPTYSKQPLSSSTHGRGIKVTTAAPIDGSDTAIHTAVASLTDRDEITLFAYNDATTYQRLEIAWGGTTDPDDLIILDVPPRQGFIPVVLDLLLRNSLAIVASAETINVVTIHGWVNQIRA